MAHNQVFAIGLGFLWISLIFAIDLEPLRPHSCPDNDLGSHTCYNLHTYNTTCINVTIGNCHVTDTSSSEDKDDASWPSRHFHFHHHRPHEWPDKCYEISSGKCTVYTCMKKCCDGWMMGDTYRCDVESDGSIQCENGGTYFQPYSRWEGRCRCPAYLTGKWCEKAICRDECYNGGSCVVTSEGNKCSCPPPTTGTNCQEVNCPVCENGGECVVDGSQAVCVCPPGFHGKNCLYASDETIGCPSPNFTVCSGQDLLCENECLDSNSCPYGEVCCNDGCCNKCVAPVKHVCRERDQYYKVGDMLRMDACSYCTCLPGGFSKCQNITCVDLKCQDDEVLTYKKDMCCSVCQSQTFPPGYMPPTFSRCYHGVKMSLTVPSFTDTVHTDSLGIQAYDYENKKLQVHYSPETIQHCKCSLSCRNLTLVSVQVTDSYGQRQECNFYAYVMDNTPPYFYSCPTDIFAVEDEVIYWKIPEARDNVGVRRLTVNANPRQKFPVGNTTVTYTAYDYDYNHAECQFTVYVYKQDIPDSDYPAGLLSRKSSSATRVIAICVSVFVLVLMVLTVICLVKRLRVRNVHRTACNASRSCRRRPNSPVSNEVYGGQMGPFPDFKGASVKLPPYSPASAPPAYDELSSNGSTSAVNTAFSYDDVYTDSPPTYEDIAANADTAERTESARDETTIYDTVSTDTVTRGTAAASTRENSRGGTRESAI